jgi:hypothetical protein
MITAYSPAMNTHRTNYNNRSLKFGDKLPKETLVKAIENKDASKINTFMGLIGMGKYTKEENKGLMEEITKKYGGHPAVGALNKAFGFNFPKK